MTRHNYRDSKGRFARKPFRLVPEKVPKVTRVFKGRVKKPKIPLTMFRFTLGMSFVVTKDYWMITCQYVSLTEDKWTDEIYDKMVAVLVKEVEHFIGYRRSEWWWQEEIEKLNDAVETVPYDSDAFRVNPSCSITQESKRTLKSSEVSKMSWAKRNIESGKWWRKHTVEKWQRRIDEFEREREG